jgi:methylase of polypeptide subunit release factors
LAQQEQSAKAIELSKRCVSISTALRIEPTLQNYLIGDALSPRIDLGSSEALLLYNRAVLKAKIGVEINTPPSLLVPTACLRLTFIEETIGRWFPLGGLLLEIGTGSSAILAMIAARLYNCRVVATEVNNVAFESARTHIAHNHLTDHISLLRSRGQVIRGLTQRKFDAILSYPPQYESYEGRVHVNRGFRGVWSELVGGGDYGENLAERVIKEAHEHLLPGGFVFLLILNKKLAEILTQRAEEKELATEIATVRTKSGRERFILSFRLVTA